MRRREGVVSVVQFFAVAFAKAGYYALYSRNIVVRGNYKGAYRLPRLLAQNMYAARKISRRAYNFVGRDGAFYGGVVSVKVEILLPNLVKIN